MSKSDFLVYNASAGSGKTFTLTKEYLIKLFKNTKNDGYKNILAITFTNKAVNEMKSRILRALYEFSKTEFNQKAIDLFNAIKDDEAWLSEEMIREKSKKIIRHLLHEYSSFDVLTIDKFTHKLIRSFAQNLEFSENFEVIINPDDLINQAIARVMANVGEDELLTNIVLDFANEKTDEDKSWDISIDLKDIAKQLTKEEFKQDIDQLKAISLEDYVVIKKDLFARRNHIKKQIYTISTEMLDTFEKLGITVDAFNRGNFFHFFKNNLSNPQQSTSTLNEFINKEEFYKKTTDKFQKTQIDSISSQIKVAVEQINDCVAIYNLCELVLKKITPMALLQKINEEMDAIQEEENSKLLASFNHVIQAEIQNQPALFLYEKLGSKYHHYFIDEFQDTSKLQWENLKPLIENALSGEYIPGQSGTLMIVGDPKQAIYRFRNGDAEQFINLSDNNLKPFSNPSKLTIPLETNWRSLSEIIGFNNDYFKFISAKFQHDLYKDLYENKSAQKKNKNEKGYVEIQFIDIEADDSETNEEESAIQSDIVHGDIYFKMILKTIGELVELGYKHKDIAILVNRNNQGNFLAKKLIEKNILIISPDALKLTNSKEVLCVISLLKYIANPQNNEEKVNFILLLKSTENSAIDWSTVEQSLLKTKSLKELSTYLNDIFRPIDLELLLNQSLFDSVEKIVKVLFPRSQSNGYLQYFLDLVYEKNIKGQIGLFDFLALWDEKSTTFLVPTPSDTNAVQILTIHKSKGLEFPVVIYPFATESISKRIIKDEFFVENTLDDIALPVLLMKATKSLSNFGESFSEIYEQKREQVLLDLINLQYVALTRAAEHLYIFTEAKKNKAGDLLPDATGNYFAEFIKSQLGDIKTFQKGERIKYKKEEEKASTEESLPIIAATISEDAIKIAQNEALLWDSKKQEAIAFGNILHLLMKDVIEFKDIAKTIDKHLAKGIIDPTDQPLFKLKLNEMVNHPQLRFYFTGFYQVLNERPLINHLGEVLIPDKLVFHSPREVSILDYKTGSKSPTHANQINNYAEALSQMGYQIKDKILVYVGEDLEVESI